MPVAIHCEPVCEPYTPYASLKTRWIAASDCCPPRNDKACCHREPGRRGDPLGTGKRTVSLFIQLQKFLSLDFPLVIFFLEVPGNARSLFI